MGLKKIDKLEKRSVESRILIQDHENRIKKIEAPVKEVKDFLMFLSEWLCATSVVTVVALMGHAIFSANSIGMFLVIVWVLGYFLWRCVH